MIVVVCVPALLVLVIAVELLRSTSGLVMVVVLVMLETWFTTCSTVSAVMVVVTDSGDQ